ncbi:nucleoside diphosphate kinase regulator [Acuticoccus sp. M5D2P5]|uniref:nucleoside diphosphate kinase regulator n=1 Tax=Acuticoccus kalidii TaxID=2910977 RepID=UPI001F1D1145|nr:nucleoside diphosphate kinase regulator [Acuticoccus kalidii]MCF3933757.1 nucleoside diphosphate kinase regulator [Acuticoccus kalidii]
MNQNTGGSTAQTNSPHITLTARDYEQLAVLARAAANRIPDVSAILTEELERADIVADGRPEQNVYMGATVVFQDDTVGKVQTVSLVYPAEADIAQGKISILTPIGAALIGVRVGDSITWETRAGAERRLTVLEVREPRAD